MSKTEGTDERCCGNCKYMVDEDTYGFGLCSILELEAYCGDVCELWEKEE